MRSVKKFYGLFVDSCNKGNSYHQEPHFETLTVKLSLNAITTQKIADFQNSVTCHTIIVVI